MSVLSPDLRDILNDVEQLKKSVKKLEDGLAANTALTKQVADSTAEVVEVFKAAEGAFKVFEWIGKAAKPLFWLVTATGAVLTSWTAIKAWASHLLK